MFAQLCNFFSQRTPARTATVSKVAALCSLILLTCVFAAVTAHAQSNCFTLYPTGDSYTQNGSSVNMNYGTSQSLLVKNIASGPSRYTYLKFDLSNVSGPITSATLQIYGGHAIATAGYTGTDSIYAVADNTWTQAGITWASAPIAGAKISSTTVTPTQQYYCWDMTSYLQANATAGNTAAGVCLQMDAKPSDNDPDTFKSTGGTLVPRLLITVGYGTGPAALNATVTSNQTVLSWPAVANATGYTIQRANAPGGPFTTIGTSSTNAFTDSGTTPGTTDYYTVSATVNGGMTTPSPVASVTLGTVIILTPIADVYVQNGTAAGTNFGAATTIQAKKPGSNPARRSYLRFDLSSIPGPIQSASLQLYGGNNSPSGYTGSDSICGVSDPTWTETGVTYMNAPVFGSAIASAPITSAKQWHQWDVTAYAQNTIIGGTSLMSLGLSMDAATTNHQGDIFNSKEAATNQPQLIVTVQPQCVTFVNPLIGTDVPATASSAANAGGVFPGADVPFGMVQLSPNTPSGSGGYSYQDSVIRGFAHTHLSGAGARLGGDVTLMPTTGAIQTQPLQYGSSFSHGDEYAAPGYYNVNLTTYGIRAELTATTHTGWHRYTFPATTQANVLVDLSSSFRGAQNGAITVVDSQTIQGSIQSFTFEGTAQTNNPLPYTVYFVVQFDHPFTSFGTWTGTTTTAGSTSATGGNSGAYATFDATANPVVIAKVGLSYVSITGAQNNLAAETADFNFDATHQDAVNAWQSLLSRVQVTGGTTAQLTSFYTALYHSLLHPNVFSDADGSFIGFDNQIHTASYTTYTNFSMWDTYRTQSELLDLIAPERAHDQMASLMEIYNETGWLPRWVQNNLETNAMIGDPAAPILVDAYLKGIIPDLNATTVYTALTNNANNLPPVGSEFEGRLGLGNYLTSGYVPYVPGATGANFKLQYGGSTTLEYSLDDGALALMAQAMGNTADYNSYITRAQSYTSIFDTSAETVHARLTDGTFNTPFDPTSTSQGFKESSADQYMWTAPQDIFGLMDLMGGATAASASLDTFFALTQLQSNPASTISTIWGQPGYYTPYNEEDLQAAYLYPYFGQAYKTQMIVNDAETLYTNAPGGIPGNDDLGAMSAWYVLSALGLYPVSPGSSFYILTTPLFPMAKVSLQSPYYTGASLTIAAPNVSPTNGYIQSMTINGSPWTKAWVTHSQLQSGPVLSYTVGAAANTAFAAGTANNPPSVVPAH